MGLISKVNVVCLSMCSALMFMGVKLLILFVHVVLYIHLVIMVPFLVSDQWHFIILGIFLFGENWIRVFNVWPDLMDTFCFWIEFLLKLDVLQVLKQALALFMYVLKYSVNIWLTVLLLLLLFCQLQIFLFIWTRNFACRNDVNS